MEKELNIYELGKFLSLVSSKYKAEILAKINLNGGWMTFQDEVEITATPEEGIKPRGNNVITMRLKTSKGENSPIKIIGAKDGKFKVSVEPKKIVEIHTGGLGLQMEKEKKGESTVKIDEGIVITVNAGVAEVLELI